MLLDGYWKKELSVIGRQLSFWCRCSFLVLQSYAEHRINRGLLYSAAIIRKITEDETDAENESEALPMPMPSLPVLKITVSVTRYRHTDEDKFFSNSRVFLCDYDLQNGQDEAVPLKQACNQIIHSYAWAIVHHGNRGIYGALVASDREKEKDIILLAISDWISVIRKVVDQSNI